jgi:hypothetical protein
LYAIVTASQPEGSPMTHQSGAGRVARYRAPLARRRLLLDGADDGHAHAGHHVRGRGDESRERSLRVHRTAADELAALDADRDAAGDGIDMPEEDHVARTVADLADRVARLVARRAEAPFSHARDEPLDGGALLARDARDLDEAADQRQVALVERRRYASTFAVAATTRSICSAVITSGGR